MPPTLSGVKYQFHFQYGVHSKQLVRYCMYHELMIVSTDIMDHNSCSNI